MSIIKKLSQRLKKNTIDGNTPFVAIEMQEVAKTEPKFRLFSTEPNRKARRIPENAGKILNCRKQTKGRKGNNVLNRMAEFSLKLHYLRTTR